MMVANNHVYALCSGIVHLFNGLDAAVKGDDQAEISFGSPVDAFVRYSISLIIAVRDIEIDIACETLYERKDKCHRRGAVDIIISVDKNLLARHDSLVQPLHRHVHILHEERIMQVIQTRAEKCTSLFESFDSSLDKKIRKHLVDPYFSGEALHLCRIGRFLDNPLAFSCHILQS